MITAERAKDIRERIETFNRASEPLRHKNGWLVLSAEQRATLPTDASNDEKSALEVYEFMTEPPEKYLAYIGTDGERAKEIRTWTGEKLGNVRFGREWRDSFGGRRVPITVTGINGIRYHGTYYKSSGDFCRIKRAVR